MSKGPVIVVLILALLLGGATFFVIKRPAAAPPPQPIAWLAGLDANQIRSFQVEWGPREPVASFVREATTEEWMLTRAGTKAWPVRVELLRPFLRLLNDVGRLDAQNGTRGPADGTRVSFALTDNTTRTIRVGDSPLGGRVPAAIDDTAGPRVVQIDDGIRRMLRPESLLGWREARLIPRSGVEPSRVTLETGKGRVSMARVQGRWALISPLACQASDDAMKTLVRQIASMRGERLMDEVAADGPIVGADAPIATIRLESDLRIPHGDTVERRTLVEEVRVGKSADMGGAVLYAAVGARLLDPATNTESSLWGPTTITISKEKLDAIPVEPSVYASKRAIPMPGADVNAVTLWADSKTFASDAAGPMVPPTDARKFTLSAKGWNLLHATHAARPLEGADAAGVAALVRALGDVDSAAVGTQPSAEISSLACCVVEGVGGAGSMTVELGSATDGGRAILVVRTGKVVRMYNEEWAGGLIAWIRGQMTGGH